MSVLAGLFPASVLELANGISQRSTREALFNLGYLSRDAFHDAQAYRRASMSFRAEYRLAAPDLELLSLPDQRAGELSDAEAGLLRRLAGLEGDFEFRRMPRVGESGLLVRVARLRLNLFGSVPCHADVFSDADLALLGEIADWPDCLPHPAGNAEARVLAALNAAGDPVELIRRVWEGSVANMVAYFHSVEGEQSPPVTSRFRRTLRASLGAGSEAFREFGVCVPIPPAPPDIAAIAVRLTDPRNARALRFAQIMAWIDGYYQGRIDEAFGPVTRSAVQARIHDDRRADEKTDPGPCFAYVGSGYWTFNHVLFFRRIFETGSGKSADGHAAEREFIVGLEESYAGLSTKAQADAQQRLYALAAPLADPALRFVADRPGQGGHWFSGFRRIFAWLRTLCERFFQALHSAEATHQCRIVALGLFRRLGEALSLLARGTAYLLGARELFVVTADRKEVAAYIRFGTDFDGLSLVSATATPDQAAELARLCQSFGKAIGAVLRFIAVVIAAILDAGRLSWLGLALLILRLYIEWRNAADAALVGPRVSAQLVREHMV